MNKSKNIKKIYLISFPHKKHLNKTYNINVSSIIDNLILPDKFVHINFTKIVNENNFKTENIYEPLDDASHLTDDAQIKLIEYIFEYTFNDNSFTNIKS